MPTCTRIVKGTDDASGDGPVTDHSSVFSLPIGPMRKFWVHLACLFVLLVASLVVWIRTLPKTKTFAQVLGAANAHLQHTYSTTFRNS